METQTTVGTYLTTRLEQLQVKHLFSVPGDYTSDFLEIVDTQSTIKRIGNCNELNAGYAADGYARANGLGAVAVTTGVGSFSLLNAIGGSYVEKIPVVAIIGTLSNSKLLDEIDAGELYHHNVNDTDTNRTVYAPVTVAFERISNPIAAPAQIDAALTACISKSRPVAIEIMEDCYYMPCSAPQGEIVPIADYVPLEVLEKMADGNPPNKYAKQIVDAVNTGASEVYQLLKKSKKPIFWIGKEIAVSRLHEKFKILQEEVKAPFVSSLLGKAVMPEDNLWFLGMHDGVFTAPHARRYLKDCDCLIGLGVWNTDLNVFGSKTNRPGNIAIVFASRNMLKVKEDIYVQVSLEHLIDALLNLIETKGYDPVWQVPDPPVRPVNPPLSEPVTYDSFFDLIENFITPENLIVADVGLSTFGGSSSLTIARQNGFLAQTIWASIGWSVPAGLGASFTDDTRAIVIVGDGAFKLTCQAVSTMVQEKRNTVVFVLNNKVYGVEQMLLNPAPYKQGSNAPFEAANILQEWDYISLMEAYSNKATNAFGIRVKSVEDLQNALDKIRRTPEAAFLVSIDLNERDYPSAWQRFVG